MIGIVDYGAGNLKSIEKAFDFLHAESKILTSADEFAFVDSLLLPGVGSFGYAMERIKERGLYEPLKKWIESNRPFLGICLGLQFLFESSQESVGIEGLSVFKGICKKFSEKKVPQIGWNNIRIVKDSDLLKGIPTDEFFYFVHSYYVAPEESDIVIAVSNYGVDFTSILGRGKVFAVQFHPEKSGHVGLKLLKNWVELC